MSSAYGERISRHKRLPDAVLFRYFLPMFLPSSSAWSSQYPGCRRSAESLTENVHIRDSVAIRWQDSIRWHIRDSVNIIEHHVTVRDSSGLFIQFAQGGGTYNSKTGEATNVAGVQQSDTHHEQRIARTTTVRWLPTTSIPPTA